VGFRDCGLVGAESNDGYMFARTTPRPKAIVACGEGASQAAALPFDDWRATVGAFSSDPRANEIIDEALRLREVERQQSVQ
jgi:hypothetical protein